MFSLTEHVSTFILAATLLGNVRLNAKVDQSQVLNGVESRVQAPDDTKTPAIVDVTAELLELRAESRERKVGRLYEVSILTEGWPATVSETRREGEHLRRGKHSHL